MLSDKLQNVKSPPRRKANDEVKRWYSDAQKIEAVKLWLVTGNLVVTGASLNIPLPTLKQWRYSKWWDEIVSEIRTEGTLQLSNRLKSVAEKAIGVTMDRLENGDWIMNQKTGNLERKPVALRDAYQVAAGLLDRHMELDRRPQEEAQQQKVQDRLEALAKAFEKFAGKQPKLEVIDVEFKDGQEMREREEGEINALHEEREEGLREGASVGENQEAESSEGPSEEGFGSTGDGESLGEQAEFDACGPQEATQIRGFKLSEQLEMDDSESEPQERSSI